MRLRDNAESIAFYRGEAREGEQALQRLGNAINNAQRLITWEALIGVIQTSYNDFSDFLPWLVIAPLFFARQVDFGVFGQAGIAFSQVLASVSYLVNNIHRLAAFSASIQRLCLPVKVGFQYPPCFLRIAGRLYHPTYLARHAVLPHTSHEDFWGHPVMELPGMHFPCLPEPGQVLYLS